MLQIIFKVCYSRRVEIRLQTFTVHCCHIARMALTLTLVAQGEVGPFDVYDQSLLLSTGKHTVSCVYQLIIQINPDTVPSSLSAHASLNKRNSLFYVTSIYFHPRCTTAKCGEQTMVPYWGLFYFLHKFTLGLL